MNASCPLLAVRSTYQWGAVDINGYNANYSYDPLDNLRSNQLGANILTYAYDSTNRLTQLTNGVGSQWAITSDMRGNITANALRNQGYEFDLAHRMNAVTGKESYLYDGHGRRARTQNLQTGSIEYFGYSKDGRLMQDWSNRRGVRNGYIYLGNTLVGLYEVNITNGAITPKYQHTDALGSPVVTTKKGALASDPPVVLSRMGYTPYGAPTMPMDGVGYTGHFVDVGTQLTYMQQRYYDPQLGRFVSIDPVGTSPINGLNFNRYWYASNNSLKNTDPDGRCDGPSTCAIDRDIAAMNSGDMSRVEFTERSEARAAGAVGGLILIAAARSPAILAALGRAYIRYKVNQRPNGVPKDWKRTDSKDGKGSVWTSPENRHDTVRTSTGDPKSSQPGQQEPYVIRQADGKRYDADGAEVPKQSKESHTPLKEYVHKTREELRTLNQ